MQPRDYCILRDIAKCGGLTSEQICLRYWPDYLQVVPERSDRVQDGKHPRVMVNANCQRRMLLLHTAGYIKRIERYQLLTEGKKPYLYTLTPTGAAVLAQHLGCSIEETGWRKVDKRLRHNYVEHLIRTNDARLAFDLALEKTGWLSLVNWRDELALSKDHYNDTITVAYEDKTTKQVRLLPDAYFLVRSQEGKSRHSFLEIDLGTEVTSSENDKYRSWMYKIRTYLIYISRLTPTGQTLFRERYGAARPRVLTVTTSEQRMENLIRASERVEAREIFWFTTFERAVKPIIKSRTETVYEHGETKEVGFYSATLPNILHDNIWRIASSDNTLHAFSETFAHGRAEATAYQE